MGRSSKRIKGFRVGGLRSPIKSDGYAYDPSLSGALFLAPTKEQAIAWALDVGKTRKNNNLYYVEVVAEKCLHRRWGHLKEIVIFPPYKIVRWEKIKEIRARDSLLAHYRLRRGKEVIYAQLYYRNAVVNNS